MISTKDIFWLAGLLEGEGCFCASNRKDRRSKVFSLQLGMTDKDVVERAAELLKTTVRPQQRPPYKTYYTLQVKHTRAISWMMTLYSIMGERRQAKIREILKLWKDFIPVSSRESGFRAAASRWGKSRDYYTNGGLRKRR